MDENVKTIAAKGTVKSVKEHRNRRREAKVEPAHAKTDRLRERVRQLMHR